MADALRSSSKAVAVDPSRQPQMSAAPFFPTQNDHMAPSALQPPALAHPNPAAQLPTQGLPPPGFLNPYQAAAMYMAGPQMALTAQQQQQQQAAAAAAWMAQALAWGGGLPPAGAGAAAPPLGVGPGPAAAAAAAAAASADPFSPGPYSNAVALAQMMYMGYPYNMQQYLAPLAGATPPQPPTPGLPQLPTPLPKAAPQLPGYFNVPGAADPLATAVQQQHHHQQMMMQLGSPALHQVPHMGQTMNAFGPQPPFPGAALPYSALGSAAYPQRAAPPSIRQPGNGPNKAAAGPPFSAPRGNNNAPISPAMLPSHGASIPGAFSVPPPASQPVVPMELNMLSIMPGTALQGGAPFCPPGALLPKEYANPPRRRQLPPAAAADSAGHTASPESGALPTSARKEWVPTAGSLYPHVILAQATELLMTKAKGASAAVSELHMSIQASAHVDDSLKQCASHDFVETVLAGSPARFSVFQYTSADLGEGTADKFKPNELRFAEAGSDHRTADGLAPRGA